MSTELPEKLWKDLRKSSELHVKELRALVDETLEHYSSANVRSTKRYSALYKGRNPAVYIEPQKDRVLLGFFRDHVERLKPVPSIRSVSFADWNDSKGGLMGFAIEGFLQDQPKIRADLWRLIEEVYRWT